MKIFIDSANVAEIKEAASWGVVSGVTTNPTLVNKAGQDFQTALKEICSLVNGPVSAEVVGLTKAEMIKEAHELTKIAENIVIKVPIVPEGLAATRELKEQGIPVNMTLVFTVNQAMLAAASGAAYVSPFIGRLDDIGTDGVACLSEIVQALSNYEFDTEIIAASIRHPMHVAEAAMMGCDIVTLPFGVIKQIMQHPLTDKGIDRFLADWESHKAKVSSDKSDEMEELTTV